MNELNPCVQEHYAMKSICFGCGPANEKGLRIRSFESNDDKGPNLIATWSPEPHHQAFPGVLNGGIVGALLDCHGNWAASMHLMRKTQLKEPPCTVTADFSVQLRRPCPVDKPIYLTARVVQAGDTKASVEAELICDGKICSTLKGTFVAVAPSHPAYHRW